MAVAGNDGRAGMAAIVADCDFDFRIFTNRLMDRLPAYAHRLFVRTSAAIDATEIFKRKKQQLIRDGFDPDIMADRLFLHDPQSGEYRLLDNPVYAQIMAGSVRL